MAGWVVRRSGNLLGGVAREIRDWWLLWVLMAGSLTAATGTGYLYKYHPDLLLKLVAAAALVAAILCLWWLAVIFGVIGDRD